MDKICSCPYDVGPVCKHIAAVLFYMQQDELNIQAKEKITKNIDFLKPKSSAKTVFEKFEETLEKISHEDLKNYIIDSAIEDASFRKHFMARFNPPKTNNSKEFFVKQIQTILRRAKRKYGFIDRSHSRFVGVEIQKLNNLANEYYEKNNVEVAFNILTAIIESLIVVFDDSDDSYGAMGASFDIAFITLWEIESSNISEDFRKMFFNYCSTNYQSKIFSEWSHDLELINIAVSLLKTEKEAEHLIQISNEVKRSDSYYEKILSARYPQEMGAKYSEFIQEYLKENLGRDHYQLMCRCIRRMKKWGPSEIVNTLIEKLRQQHPSRYALIEELDKV